MKRTPSGVHVSVGIMQFQCKWTDVPEFGGPLSLKTFSVSAGRTFTPMRTVVSVLFKVSARCLPRASLSRGNPGIQHQAINQGSGGRPLMATRSTSSAAPNAQSYLVPFIIVTALFGIFGFLTSLNNTLVAKLEDTFKLTHGPAMLATAAWFFAYLVFSVPSAKLIEAVGYKRTMVISLLIMVCGALLFIPAANMVSFHMTLVAIFVLAAGVCALQTSANPYVSILGPEHSAPARLTLAQAFNSLGSLIAPLVAARFILSDTSKVSTETSAAHMLSGPYMAIAAALLILGLTVMFRSEERRVG